MDNPKAPEADLDFLFQPISIGYDGPITQTREGGPEYPNNRPRQTDTPVQIRRARGAFIRARQHEEDYGYYAKRARGQNGHSDWARKSKGLAQDEYARAVCHALQWLLS